MDKGVQKLLEKRYFLRDKDGNFLENSWSGIANRVAKYISTAEDKDVREYYYNVFFTKINNMELIPSSPCLFNAGGVSGQLSSCFILDIEDNIEGIFQTVAECAKIFQRAGGAGFSMRKIRPKGSPCVSSGSTASGVVSFMKIFNEVVNQVKQGNKRNGALKIDLPVNHPEIYDFIHCKDNTNELNNMNISVSITEEFLNAVENNLDWNLKFNGKIYQTVKAKDLWNEIITSAWKTGEPGISFQSNMNKGNMNPHLNLEVFSNPCMEYVNIPYSSCNLASINLTKIIQDGKINWDLLKENVQIGIRFLDDMITMNKLPLPKIEEVTKAIRPVGLGTMGLADLLYELRIPYNSDECLQLIDALYSNIYFYALDENTKLAKERGCYPAWKDSRWDKEYHTKVRCSSMLSIAPNGSIAFIAETTGGIEPQFALVYTRRDNDNDKYFIIDKVFEKYLKENNLLNDNILNTIIKNKGSIKGLDNLFPKYIQEIFVTANDISPEWHVKVLAQIQKYVDLSISKTVNLPNSATVEDVGKIYMMAGKMGVKGITVYRDGSRENQVLSVGKVKENKKENKFGRGVLIECSDDLIGKKRKLITGCGSLHVSAFFDPVTGELMEIFLNKGSSGGCMAYMNALSRQISSGLRSGQCFNVVIDQLDSIPPCPSYVRRTAVNHDTSKGTSCPNALKYALLDMQREVFDELGIEEDKFEINKINSNDYRKSKTNQRDICPECGTKLILAEGCISCPNCGWSKCS